MHDSDLFTGLDNFLAAGALALSITRTSVLDGNHKQADDGWALLPSQVVTAPESGIPDADAETFDSLLFLVRHRFIAATYLVHSSASLLFVRVYLIPWDLPGSKGVLRLRDDDAVLRPGRKRLRALFLRIRQDRSLWEGDGASSSTPHHFWESVVDNRSLLEIYNDLPSPEPDTLLEHIPELDCTLYGYQRRTVSTMVARETHRGSIADPLYLPARGVDGKTFYILPATMELVSERPRISSVPGGILCEELGTGKTVMMLSLILATIDQLAAPEEAFHEERVPITPLALRHFQTHNAIAERAKLANSKVLKDTGVPSLVEIMLHQCRLAPDRSALRKYEDKLDQLKLLRPLRENAPFYLHTDPPRDVGYGAARGGNNDMPKVMYLTSATLVVVPENLQLQWMREISLHVTNEVRVLFVRHQDELPDAPVLATNYDIVLMSHPRFSKEAKKRCMDDLLTRTPCQCKTVHGSRVPRCRCSRRETASPLLQIRWKRLAIDEGHNAGEKRTDYGLFTKLLSVERRWIMTGTPTTNLLGLNFGAGSDLQYPEDDEDEDSAGTTQQRRWHNSERPDLYKLGLMFSEYLLMMPFASDPKAFATLVTNPLFSAEGLWPGDIRVLTQVMSSVMIRHRPEDVEQDIRLPFLVHETVLLDLDPYAVKAYNVIQARIAVNAVDSERRDQDYMFHPRNAAFLKETLSNISQVMFWHALDSRFEEPIANAKRCLEKLEKCNGSQEDFELIRQSIFYLQSARDDQIWIELQKHFQVWHRVENMPPDVFNAWSTFESPPEAFTEHLLPPASLLAMRDYVTNHPLRSAAGIADMGAVVVEEDRKWRDFEALQNHLKKKRAKERRPRDDTAKGSLKREAAEKKLEEMRTEYQAVSARLTAASTGEAAPVKTEEASRKVSSTLLRLSPVARVKIKHSVSTKMDYILNEVLLYSADEKFLIFSESPSTLSFIAASLELIRVKHLEFSGQLKRDDRQATITTFETSDLYRVLLMELKHGARGLNLVSASRVIFCEPVWKADVESQAIKRVHRIGQSRRVIVKTLAIRGTSEEVMVARSKALKENKQEFTKEFTDDRTMRDFIEHPTFLPIPTEREVHLDVPLFELESPGPTTSTTTDIVDPCDPPAAPRTSEVGVVAGTLPPLPRRTTVYVEIATEHPRKKRKTVSFAD